MHLGVVEAVLHDAPALVEDLRAQRLVIDLEVGGVGHLPRRRAGVAGSAVAGAAPRRRRGRRVRRRRAAAPRRRAAPDWVIGAAKRPLPERK